MGNPKQKWTAEEEEALRAGVAKHGPGKWKNIQKDPEFNPFLFSRSNIDLKDKWRNMSISAGEKVRSSKPKASSDALPLPPPPVTAAAVTPSSTSPQPSAHAAASATSDAVVFDPSKSTVDSKTAPKYNALIFEAISALNEPNGVDTGAIINYIEQRQELPQSFKRQLSSRLRRLVSQEKLEKVHNCYKIKKTSSFGSKVPSPKQKDFQRKQLDSAGFVNTGDTIEKAAVAAAYRIADAENKSFVAAEAVKEAERIAKMADETESLLQLAKEIFEKCSHGELVLIA
uniref:MYB transcription factor n=1 Tax=Rhizophora mucronata TaxID=61149 RepID=A0A2P2L4E1_RHIMU